MIKHLNKWSDSAQPSPLRILSYSKIKGKDPLKNDPTKQSPQKAVALTKPCFVLNALRGKPLNKHQKIKNKIFIRIFKNDNEH